MYMNDRSLFIFLIFNIFRITNEFLTIEILTCENHVNFFGPLSQDVPKELFLVLVDHLIDTMYELKFS